MSKNLLKNTKFIRIRFGINSDLISGAKNRIMKIEKKRKLKYSKRNELVNAEWSFPLYSLIICYYFEESIISYEKIDYL